MPGPQQKRDRKKKFVLPLPSEITDEVLMHASKTEKQPEVMIVNRSELDPTTSALLELCEEPYSSVMGLPLVVENKPLGGVVILAEGKTDTAKNMRVFFHY